MHVNSSGGGTASATAAREKIAALSASLSEVIRGKQDAIDVLVIELHLLRQVPNGGIFLLETDGNIQHSGKPRLGFFDRERSRHRSGHAFDMQDHFGILRGEFRLRIWIVLPEGIRGEGHQRDYRDQAGK